jgi:two-component system, LytTR family, sensor kinase
MGTPSQASFAPPFVSLDRDPCPGSVSRVTGSGRTARGAVSSGMTREEHVSLSRRDIALIVLFWVLYAVLAIASRVLDVPDARFDLTSGFVMVPLVEAAAWAILTPVIFSLAGRSDGGAATRRYRIALFLVLGVIIALLVAVIGRELRASLPPPPWAPHRTTRPPLWLGFLNSIVIYLGVLAAGLARAYSLRYRSRERQATELQSQLAEVQLEALRRQLDPHFLFNTLNAVSSLVERDPRGVRRMIARLSELLRYSLDAENSPEIPLRKELDLLGRYLEIMQIRFQGRLDVRQSVADEALDALVPTLLLQPLVENAIKHGVEKLDEGGRIAIEAAPDGDMLVLRVRDNGPDAAPSPLPSGANGRGVGLQNTLARLERLYGQNQRFALVPSDQGPGMTAEVRIPLRRSPIV